MEICWTHVARNQIIGCGSSDPIVDTDWFDKSALPEDTK